MTRMDRLILAEVTPLFVGSTLLFTSLILAGGELLRFAEYLQKGESVLLVARLLLLTLPGMLTLTFPMAMLLATLLGFGRLSSDSEIIALTAAGVRFERIVVPVVLLSLLVSLAGLWFSNSVVPASSRGRNQIIDGIKRNGGGGIFDTSQLTARLTDDKGALNTLIHVEGAAKLSTGDLENVSVEIWQEGRVTDIFYAPRAKWMLNTKDWTLYDFRAAHFEGRSPGILTAASGQTTEKKIKLDTPEQLAAALEIHPEDADTSDLRRRSQILRKGGNVGRAREFDVEVARRNALPFASFCFTIIGAPLGINRQRSGRGVGFGWSVVITFAYWVGLQVASVVARNGAVSADIVLAIPNLICIVVGLYLIRRVLR